MTVRVTDPEVREIIETDETVRLDPFIRTANRLTDWLDAQDTDDLLSTDLLFEIELHLAAHFYERHRDKNLQSKSTGRASGQFQGQTGLRLESSDPGQTAMLLDVTGRLQALSEGRKRVRTLWLGDEDDSARPDTDAIY